MKGKSIMTNNVNVTRERNKRVEVLISPKLYEQLKAKARADGLTMSAELKLAIKKQVEEK